MPRWALRLGAAGAAFLPVSDEKIGFEYKAKRFLRGCLPARQSCPRLLERCNLPRPGSGGSCRRHLDSILRELSPEGDDLEAYLRFDQQYYLPDDLLAKVDRMSMAHSIEVRPPYLDHRIVEFAATLPANLKIRGSRQKIVLRELMTR